MKYIPEFNVSGWGAETVEVDETPNPPVSSSNNIIRMVLGIVGLLIIIAAGIGILMAAGVFDEKYIVHNTTYLACGNANGAYDMINMDEYGVMGSQSSASVPAPCSIVDQIHESLAYDCYTKPDAFLKKLDRPYQPYGVDGVGVLSNTTV